MKNVIGGEGRPAYYGLFDSLGQSLKTPTRVSNGSSIIQPRLALSSNYVALAWEDLSGSLNSYIDGRVFSSQTPEHSNEVQFNSEYFDAYRGPADVVFFNDTTFIVVWGGDGPETASLANSTGIYGQITTVSLNFLDGNLLLTDHVADNVNHGFPRAASCPGRSDFLVVWRDDHSGSFRVYGRLFHSDGSPKDSSFLISEDPQLTDLWFISVAANNTEEYEVVWGGQRDSAHWNIQMRRLGPDGTPRGPSVGISTNPDMVVPYPSVDIAFDHDGSSIVVWEQKENGFSRIYAQRFLSDGSFLGGNFRISFAPEESSNHFWPSVVLHRGKIYTAWAASSGGTSRVWANVIDFHNSSLGTRTPNSIATDFYLYPNYPNPFNPTTSIKYEVQKYSYVLLLVFNMLGEEVTTLIEKAVPPGVHQVKWDGKDRAGADVASGIYFYQLTLGHYTLTRKMLLIR